MSNDKRKSLRRRMRLLMKAMERPIKTNCQGGMSGDNPDLMRLIDDKHVEHVRDVLRHGDGVNIGPKTNTTYRITEAGKLFYMRHKDILLTAEQKQQAADAAFDRRIVSMYHNDPRDRKKANRRERLRQRNDLATRSASAARIRHEAFKNASEELGERYKVVSEWLPKEDLLRTPEGALFAAVTGFVKENCEHLFPTSTMSEASMSLTEVFTMFAPRPKSDLTPEVQGALYLNSKLIALCRPDGGGLLTLNRKCVTIAADEIWESDRQADHFQVTFEASEPTTATFLMFQFRGMTPYTLF